MVVANLRRAEDGRLAARVSVDVLIGLVKEIAEEAARIWSGSITAPWEVGTGQWNKARLRWCELGIDVPEAKNVLAKFQVAFRDASLSWPTLLAILFLGEADPRRALAARAAHLRPAVTDAAAAWSLVIVALNEEVLTFATIAAYDAARLRMIRKRRGPRRRALLYYLVEGIEIARVCGGWASALAAAALAPSPEMAIEIRRSTPIAELQLLYFAETGAFGS